MRILVKRAMALLAVLVVLGGCSQPQKTMSEEDVAGERYLAARQAIRDAKSVPVAYVSMGCTGHGNVGYIHSYAVQETVHGQFSRGMISGLSCGGTVIAGYPVPRAWTPGMKVKVRWKPNGRDYIEKTTTIPRYDAIGMLYVHFFPNDEVRVVVSQVGVLNPEHPIPSGATVPPPEMD